MLKYDNCLQMWLSQASAAKHDSLKHSKTGHSATLERPCLVHTRALRRRLPIQVVLARNVAQDLLGFQGGLGWQAACVNPKAAAESYGHGWHGRGRQRRLAFQAWPATPPRLFGPCPPRRQ